MNEAAKSPRTSRIPLSALLSQVLVAFTIELDNEFARRMGESGYPSGGLSWIIWSNLIRFIAEGISARELDAKAMSSDGRVKFELGCLERWRFVSLQPGLGDTRPIRTGGKGKRAGQRENLREGWGSGRSIRNEWIVRLTVKGQKAAEIWPILFSELEQRWQKRFGAEQIIRLRQRLEEIANQLDLELPQALPPEWITSAIYPSRVTQATHDSSLLTLLSQVLLAFAIEFDLESKTPLSLCANVLRVLADGPVRLADLPRLTGGSPERTAIGWQLKPYISVVPDRKASRGKFVRLTPRGKQSEQAYHQLTPEIEKRWRKRFGDDAVSGLRESLRELFEGRAIQECAKQSESEISPMSQGLVPPAGVARSGAAIPALGRRKIASAAQQRVRDLVAQTEMFVRDPAGTLPHYPLWDMNRGFGP